MENPKYLTCPFCPAQAYPNKNQTRVGLTRYECPAMHDFFIFEEDEPNGLQRVPEISN